MKTHKILIKTKKTDKVLFEISTQSENGILYTLLTSWRQLVFVLGTDAVETITLLHTR